jgi:uncharacterized protein (TIGR02001 family)
MKGLITTCLGLALSAAASMAAAAEISGNVSMASDYRFRGISQLEGKFSPAIQGGFDLETESGFYVGTWASNINFFGGSIETDVYAGFAGKFDEDLEYDVGVLYYGYPHATVGAGPNDVDIDYYEVYASISFSGATLGINYSPDYFAETGKFYYPYADYGFDINEQFSVSAHLGYNGFDKKDFLGNDDKYLDWSVGISTEQLGVEWALTYVDTDLDSDSDCAGDKDLCAATVVFSISKSL